MGANWYRNQRARVRLERLAELRAEGKAAALAGRHRETNPYHGSTYFVHWAEGYDEGEAELEAEGRREEGDEH